MATPRRGWFKAANDILEHYPDAAVRGAALGMMAVYSKRWANGATVEELKGEILLTRGELLDAAGRGDSRSATSLLRKVNAFETRTSRMGVHIKFPKFSEFQELGARSKPRENPPDSPKQSKAEQSKEKNPPTPRKRGRSVCPDSLPQESRDRVKAWAAKNGIESWKLTPAWAHFRDWAHSKDRRMVNWEKAFKNSLRDGWSMKQPGDLNGRQPGGAEHHGAQRYVKGRDPNTGEVLYE